MSRIVRALVPLYRWVSEGEGASPTVTPGSAAAYWDSTEKNTANRLLRKADGTMLAAGAYDGVGNLLAHPDYGTFQYDGEGRMNSATAGAPPVTATYAGTTRLDECGRAHRPQVAWHIISGMPIPMDIRGIWRMR